VVIVANIGLPNAMTQMVNSWKDQIPILVAVASVEQDALGRDLTQETDHGEVMTQPITKWHWSAKTTEGIPETTRRHEVRVDRALRTGVPLAADQCAARTGQGRDLGPGQVRCADAHPSDKDDIEKDRARAHRGAHPLISVGDEIAWCRAEKELLKLAELLGLPVAGQSLTLGYWSRPFPTQHPLYVGALLRDMRYPGKPDVLLNLGNKFGERASPGTRLISIRVDPASLAAARLWTSGWWLICGSPSPTSSRRFAASHPKQRSRRSRPSVMPAPPPTPRRCASSGGKS